MQKLPISVFIIAKDEEDRIPRPIKSVIGWVDEVIVIDSGSSDKTMAVSASLGAKTVFNEWKGYGPQKVYGETLCKNQWLLNIDADEEITPELRDEIIELFKAGEPQCKAYHVRIKVLGTFDKNPHRFAPYHNQLRLYHKDFAGFKDSTVHDSVVPKDGIHCPLGQLKNIIHHRTFRSYGHAIAKINRYSTMQAEHMYKKGRKPSSVRIIFEPFIGFFKGYFMKRHFLMGIDGFIESIIYTFGRVLRLIKAREMWKKHHMKQQD
ncbi:MAG: glycosyltransferase family 2 protein [Rickettsiales bacterium]|nr:glycosyltransferase family 2 protein [Pseudomonadota bacterium]MDA0967200.1 glycosyltransferase family 2 protein [Pseudomonadota bacterium]MDG4544139.1 glycosyltransferase family 2 protein [Rickettsiales bacterium]MDG4546320.1 glycosyltransferase family 2 protein [Rickettsiales bacterium]MDG4548463.1 glycosyltransferase family 2 protein [Rickettsiales bacterium]